MKKLFVSQSLAEVELRQSVLAEYGIACVVRNQYTGIARGEIPFTETWPQLWVLNDADMAQAQTLLEHGQDSAAEAPEAWTCPSCGEEIEAQFSSCWNCSQERPA